MFQHDYLMRMIMQLIEAIMRSMQIAKDKEDPQAAADMLEGLVSSATNLDGGVLLSLTPDSISSILGVSNTDPRVAEFLGRTLFLEAFYLRQCGKLELAQLRLDQARALAEAYGFNLDEELGAEEAMEAFLAEQQRRVRAIEEGRDPDAEPFKTDEDEDWPPQA